MIGPLCFGFVAGAALVILLVELWILPADRQAQELVREILTADRDSARNEAKVYRGALFPGITKIEAEAPAKTATVAVAAQCDMTITPLRQVNRRRPFRIRFKENTARTNTPQKRTDALASALEKIPVQEKSNA